MDLTIFGEDVKEYAKRRNVLKDNIRKLYSTVWGQCSNPMRAKLGAVANYPSINELKDSAALLRNFEGISYQYDGHCNPYLTLDDAKSNYYAYYQKGHETNTLHFNKLKALVEIVEPS